MIFDARLVPSANHASLREQGQNGKARALSRVGEPEDHGRKREKAPIVQGETRSLEIDGFDRGALKQ